MRLKETANTDGKFIFSPPSGTKEKIITPPEVNRGTAGLAVVQSADHATPKAKTSDDVENWKGNPWSQEEVRATWRIAATIHLAFDDSKILTEFKSSFLHRTKS
jgi:hypothetical protein